MKTLAQLLAKFMSDQPAGPVLKATGFYRQSTRQKRYRRDDRQNHSQSASKARRVMAAKSNRVNRQRCRRWKF